MKTVIGDEDGGLGSRMEEVWYRSACECSLRSVSLCCSVRAGTGTGWW